ncbi:NAD(P)-dependent oxidoreductase [Lachnospiraceae bacterium 54-11]
MGNILITGATGFIGSLLVRKILADGMFDALLLPVRNRDKAETMYKTVGKNLSGKLHFAEASLEELDRMIFPMPVDYIIHCASVTQSAEMISHPVETADSIILCTRSVLDAARRLHIKSMVYLSSMEVYGKVRDTGRRRKEDELGELSLESVRSCYSLGKRVAEHYCHIYQQEYQIPVKIARLAQIFGKGIRSDDNRVYMQFARAVYEERDIVLKTKGNSIGNYCASEDAVNAIFTILNKGIDGEVYNVVNETNTMSVRDMAELVVRQIAGNRIKVQVKIEDSMKTGYAPDTGLRLSGEKLRQTGWQPTKGLVQMYRDVLSEMEEKL